MDGFRKRSGSERQSAHVVRRPRRNDLLRRRAEQRVRQGRQPRATVSWKNVCGYRHHRQREGSARQSRRSEREAFLRPVCVLRSFGALATEPTSATPASASFVVRDRPTPISRSPKTTPIGEKRTIQFRGEFFNLFNHPQFALPSPAGTLNQSLFPSSANFGLITGTSINPRLIQFALRIQF